MPGFECEQLSASATSLWAPTLAVCVRVCKMKQGDAAVPAQNLLVEQGGAPARTTFHLSCTEVPEAELTAEPLLCPELNLQLLLIGLHSFVYLLLCFLVLG